MKPVETPAPVQSPPVTLADPLKLACGVTLTNRIAKSAMSEQLGSRGNDTTPELINLYRQWAAGGLGLQVTGNVMVDRRSVGEALNIVIEDDRDLDGLKRWAEAAKSGGAPAIVQLNHPGRITMRTISSQIVAPSAVRVNIPGAPFPKPRALEGAEVEEIIQRFATAAEVSVRAGFDGIQLHGAHGYLISQFLSPLSNQRDDEWGGDAERRRRFAIELARATRAAVGPDKIVAIKLNSADFQRGGFSEEESLEVVRLLGEEGLDFLEISGGTFEKPAMVGATAKKMSERSAAREAYFLDFAAKAKAVTPMPLMVTGGLRSSAAMTAALGDGVDIIGVARPVCLEPDLPRRLVKDKATISKLKPIRTGISKLDSPAELWWSNIQLRRLGAGKRPRRGLTGWEAVGHALVRDGINGVRRKRA
ncbi:MAG: NADH:flavin oxidoreductase/NADH oxidase family protein [Thermoleophilaceae bacterium]|nr:NADH:flavin oxidoreductase/NADH oxidase family protein [Thermoleophilaceae bacterium]